MPQIFAEHFTLKDKVEYLQRKIILNCIAYYEFDWSPLDNDYYKQLCEQLIKLQTEYGDISDTQYGYVMHDFDVSTGFDLYYRLTELDRTYLTNMVTTARVAKRITHDSKGDKK